MRKTHNNNKRVFQKAPAFTLIELLIVIAIIAILALIALPNFIEAQTRAKVSRVKSDFRSLGSAIEAYFVDHNMYPWHGGDALDTGAFNPLSYRAWRMTTPVAYITNVDFPDVFIQQGVEGGYSDDVPRNQYNFRNCQFAYAEKWPVWILNSIGPDQKKDQGLKVEYAARNPSLYDKPNQTILYDPSNGTISAGDIPWTGGQTAFRNR